MTHVQVWVSMLDPIWNLPFVYNLQYNFAYNLGSPK